VPLFPIISIIVLAIWGGNALPDILFGLLACILLLLSIFVLFNKQMPLSLEPTARNRGASIVRSIFSILGIGALAFGHYFITKLDLLVWIACPFLLLGCFLVLRVYRTVTWDDVEG
ncbi:MAG TPA: hypothetical protein VFU05_06785, partial [Cyclobacteriaceae bacterium]|nr:hypothetical protein [Cyclobacteriaceae bacterium]